MRAILESGSIRIEGSARFAYIIPFETIASPSSYHHHLNILHSAHGGQTDRELGCGLSMVFLLLWRTFTARAVSLDPGGNSRGVPTAIDDTVE
jgi:hypothetical protein